MKLNEIIIVIILILIFGLYFLPVVIDKEENLDFSYTNIGKCEEIKLIETSQELFSKRYILTNKNRILVDNNDNIVTGDSLCTYQYRSLNTITKNVEWFDDYKFGIKNKKYLYTKE